MESLRFLERAMGIEPPSEAGKLTPRAADRSNSAVPRNEAQKRAGKQSAADEASLARKGTVLTPIDSNWNLAEAATSSFAVSWELNVWVRLPHASAIVLKVKI